MSKSSKICKTSEIPDTAFLFLGVHFTPRMNGEEKLAEEDE
jgi:hypothetical protein